MKRFLSLLAIVLVSTNVGCTLCSSCDDYTYGAYGGLWERSDLTYGRVGSAFSPGGYAVLEEGTVSSEDGARANDPDAGSPPAEATPPPANSTPPRSSDDAPGFDPEESSLLDT